MNGIEAASQLKNKVPNIPVVIYTMLEDVLGKSLAKTLGVKGIVSKADGLTKLLANIEAILEDTPTQSDNRPQMEE
jgi:DNA-binding NarL/FixJ family response regulator